jgi:hypothetical protein
MHFCITTVVWKMSLDGLHALRVNLKTIEEWKVQCVWEKEDNHALYVTGEMMAITHVNARVN